MAGTGPFRYVISSRLWHRPLNGSDTIQKDFLSGIPCQLRRADEMEWAKLIEIFSLCNQPYDGAYRASPPTADSIRRIDQVLKVTLPPAFARFAEEGPIYGNLVCQRWG